MKLTASSKLDDSHQSTIQFSIAELRGFSFIGDYAPNAKIQYYGPFGEYVSMGNVSMQMCHELLRHFDNVALHNFIPVPWIDKTLEAKQGLNLSAPVGIFLGTPDAVPESFFAHPISIGGFVCETNAIDPLWVDICNRLDLVFVPTHWCKSAFKNSGVTVPILVVPHGIEPEYRPYDGLLKNEPFAFYNTFHSSSFCSRKSLDELVRAFLSEFRADENVVLKLRTDLSPKLLEAQRRFNFSDRVIHVPMDHCATEDFAKLYSTVHCTVHPSKGEGFGLIPFQSIACGTPVIAPHATGMRDYLNDQNSIEVATAGECTGEGVGNSHGTYFRIDEDDLRKQMRYVFENWSHEKQKVMVASEQFRQQHAWSAVLAEFVALLQELIALAPADAKKRLEHI